MAPPLPAAIARAAAWPDQEGALQVHPQHGIEVGLGKVEEVRSLDDPGIVDQHVEPAAPFERGVDKGAGIVRAADIGADELGAAARLLDGLRRRPPLRLVDVRHHDRPAFGRERPGTGKPDPARGTRDDHRLALKPHRPTLRLWRRSITQAGCGQRDPQTGSITPFGGLSTLRQPPRA